MNGTTWMERNRQAFDRNDTDAYRHKWNYVVVEFILFTVHQVMWWNQIFGE